MQKVTVREVVPSGTQQQTVTSAAQVPAHVREQVLREEIQRLTQENDVLTGANKGLKTRIETLESQLRVAKANAAPPPPAKKEWTDDDLTALKAKYGGTV
jgi:predicted RNase H-like nuclease (RuvC/YqgF family)